MAEQQTERYQFKKIGEGVYAVDFSDTIKVESKYTLEQINIALDEKDIPTLIKMSNYFYVISGEYRRFVHMLADTHTFDHIITPVIPRSLKNKPKQDQLLEAMDVVLTYDESTNIKGVCSYITFSCVLNGAYYGYEREINGTPIIQELPINFCRTRTLDGDGNRLIEFNFKFFDNYRDEVKKLAALSMFPQEFTKLYSEWLRDKSRGMEWKQLDPQFTRCHVLGDGTPFFCATFPELIDLKEYKAIDKSKSKLDLYRLITQKIPIGDNGVPMMTPEEANTLHKNVKNMITADGIELITSPMDVNTIDLSNKGEKSDDIIEKGTNSLYNTAGINKNLANGTGAIGIASGLIMDESIIASLYDQYKTWYKTRFKRIKGAPSDIAFSISFPKITENNRSQKLDEIKTSNTYGYGSKVLYGIVANGMTQTELISAMEFEMEYLGIQDIATPMLSSNTMNGTDLLNPDGRPKKSDGEISDTTARQRDEQTNKNRASAE